MNTITEAADAGLQLPDGNVREPGDFPPEQFDLIENVPVFAEHETTSKDGREIRFTYDELKKVADRSNRRIAESGDYAAISIGHTPSPQAKASGASDPDVVGFAGPFRIGRLGQAGQRQRFAILADFHVFKEDMSRFRKHPRRSPELWLEDSYEEMFLDPIALLGAEAPRLDLGLLYSASRHGVAIEKYAAVAPGPMSAFVPGHDQKINYTPNQGDNLMSMLTGDDLKQIVDALENTEWVQWVKSQMATDAPVGAGGGEIGTDEPAIAAEDSLGEPGLPPAEPHAMGAPPEAPPMAPEPPAAPPMAEPPAAPPAPPVADAGPPPGVPAEEDSQEKLRKAYAAMDDLDLDDEEIEQYCSSRRQAKYEADNASGEYQEAQKPEEPGSAQYSADGSADGTSKNPSAEGTADGSATVTEGTVDVEDRTASQYARNGEKVQYQRLQGQVRKQGDEIDVLKERLQYERSARVDAERVQRLTDLRFQGFQIDPEKEIERLNYSKMNDEAFESQISFITDNCQRMPQHSLPYSPEGSIFASDRPGGGKDREKYSQEHSQRALNICERRVNDGEHVNYEEILEGVVNGTVQ